MKSIRSAEDCGDLVDTGFTKPFASAAQKQGG